MFSFSSLGYFAIPVEDGIPYDSKKGVIPNIDGKVEPGLYCAGWLATGPRGVIVDTMNEAFKVGQTVAEDLVTSSSEAEWVKKVFQKSFSLESIEYWYAVDWDLKS